MTPQPDFLRPMRRPHRLAWTACATALLVLALAGRDALQAWQALAQAQVPAPEPQPVMVAAPSAAQASTERAMQTALARLDRPWAAAFRSIETVHAPGLAWLSLGIDEAGALHLEGQVPDTASALAVARLLRRQAPWRDVVLGRTERTAGGPLQFEIHAAAEAPR